MMGAAEQSFRQYAGRILLDGNPSDLITKIPSPLVSKLPQELQDAFDFFAVDYLKNQAIDGDRILKELANGSAEGLAKLFAELVALDNIPSMMAIEQRVKEGITRFTEANPAPADLVFPADVMTGAAGDFAKLYAAYLEAPAHFFFVAYLTCLGSTVSDRLTLASELAPQPRLFALLLGESADDRKSTAISKTVDFFKKAMADFPVCWGVGSAEGLQVRMEKSNKLLLALDEMRQFVSKCKIEASVLLPCVNTLFESNRYESHTKQSTVRLENAHLSLLAASTIQTYENTWSSQFTDIGFNNRLWLVPGGAERRFSIPEKAPDTERYYQQTKLQKVLEHIEQNREMKITPEAKNLYHEWYMAVPRSIHAKRLDAYALRFMTLLAANDLKSEVDADTVRKVIALCDHQFKVRQLHDPVDADNETAKLEEKIRRLLRARGPLGERDLKRHAHTSKKGLWIYNTAMANLNRAKELGYHKADKRYFIRGEND